MQIFEQLKSGGNLALDGGVNLRKISPRVGPSLGKPMDEDQIRALGFPSLDLPRRVNHWREANQKQVEEAIANSRELRSFTGRIKSGLTIESRLMLAIREADGYIWLGLASTRAITDVGVNFLVDAWQNSVEIEDQKYHGIGTGTTAADQTDTDIETELTTQYQTNNTRATGSLTEGGSTNIFRTVGTNTVDASVAITEHGILDNATVGSGTLWDRHVFSAVNLSSGDSLQSTYDMTATANG